jgi:hypothetical protein
MKRVAFIRTCLALLLICTSTRFSGVQAQEKDSVARNRLLQFLENPLDLSRYKRAKGISNNGAAKRPGGLKSFYRPPDQGFYYQYFNFPIFGENSRGDARPRESLGDVAVVVYKYGRTVGDYYDPREMLIALTARARDVDLLGANLVGLDLKVVREKFGTEDITKEELSIYHANQKALIISTPGARVRWFRYVRLNFDIGSASDLPDWLIN